jgi:hypothetical protein
VFAGGAVIRNGFGANTLSVIPLGNFERRGDFFVAEVPELASFTLGSIRAILPSP